MKAPMAAPRMMSTSVGCHRSSTLPPSRMKPSRTQTRTTMEPTRKNMGSGRATGSYCSYRLYPGFLDGFHYRFRGGGQPEKIFDGAPPTWRYFQPRVTEISADNDL